jgi:acetyltransferase
LTRRVDAINHEYECNSHRAISDQDLAMPQQEPQSDWREPAKGSYPNQYTAPFQLADGTEVTIRVIRPEDEPLIIEHHSLLSDESVRRRYFGMVKHLSQDRLNRLCHLDYTLDMALVAVRSEGVESHILGVSRYYLEPATGRAEFALVVADPNQGRGLGHHLMERLIAVARDRGVKQLVGLVMYDNWPMRDLLQHLGFSFAPADDPRTFEATLDL